MNQINSNTQTNFSDDEYIFLIFKIHHHHKQIFQDLKNIIITTEDTLINQLQHENNVIKEFKNSYTKKFELKESLLFDYVFRPDLFFEDVPFYFEARRLKFQISNKHIHID